MAVRHFTAAVAVMFLFSPHVGIANEGGGVACYAFGDAVVLHVRLGRYGLPRNSKWRDPYTRDRYLMEMFGGTNYRCFRIGNHCEARVLETRPAMVNGAAVEDYAFVHLTGCHSHRAWTPASNLD